MSLLTPATGTRRSSVDLDERELLDGMEAQGGLQELELASADAVGANLHLIESDLARMTPGEHVKEAAELAAVRCQQAFEDLDQPDRCSGFRSLLLWPGTTPPATRDRTNSPRLRASHRAAGDPGRRASA